MITGITRKQHVDHHVHNEYEKLQNRIFFETGVTCSVMVQPHCISIRTENYADYCLARAAIRGQVTKEIVRDE